MRRVEDESWTPLYWSNIQTVHWLNLTATKMTTMKTTTMMTTMTAARSQVNSSNPDSTDTLEDNTAAFSLPVRVKTDLRIRGWVLFLISSFPYFLIIVLFLISLFPHHRAFPHFLILSSSYFFLHNIASIPHYHTLFYSEFKHSSLPSFPLFFPNPCWISKLHSHYSWCLKWTAPLICFNLGILFWTQKELGKWKWQTLFAFLIEVCKSAYQFLTVNVWSNTCQGWFRSHDWWLVFLLMWLPRPFPRSEYTFPGGTKCFVTLKWSH